MEMTRRDFIKNGAIITAAIAGGGLIGRTICAASAGELIEETEHLITSAEADILKYAALAPSGHNSQPWEISVNKEGLWELGIPEGRKLPAVDPEYTESKLSLGAFLMNLKIASEASGYAAEYSFKSGRGTDCIADIGIAPSKKSGDRKNLSMIESRYTHRGELSRKEFSSSALKSITGNSPVIHYFPAGTKEGRVIADGTIEANRVQAERKAAVVELSQWIRWSDDEAGKYRTGLTPQSMGIKGLAGWYVKHFYSPDDVLSESFKEKTVESTVRSVKNCGGWLIITSCRDDSRALCETGMVFEDMFLKCRGAGIGIHPMTQILEESGFSENLNRQLGTKEKIQFIIRTGYADRFPDYRKLRLPVSLIVK